MIVKELISDAISPLILTDTSTEALSLMEEFKVTHLAVIDNTSMTFIGIISEDDILNNSEPESPIKNFEYSLSKTHILEDQHIFDAISEMGSNKLSALPVLDINQKYLGMLSAKDLIASLNILSSINQAGGIIVLRMNQHDYSLGHISQIIENNDVKILSSYVSSSNNTTSVNITLKLNKTDISSVIQALERYEYNIVYALNNESDGITDLEERYEGLMTYLDI